MLSTKDVSQQRFQRIAQIRVWLRYINSIVHTILQQRPLTILLTSIVRIIHSYYILTLLFQYIKCSPDVCSNTKSPLSAKCLTIAVILRQSSIPLCCRPTCFSCKSSIIVIIDRGNVPVASAYDRFTLIHRRQYHGTSMFCCAQSRTSIDDKSQSPHVTIIHRKCVGDCASADINCSSISHCSNRRSVSVKVGWLSIVSFR